MDLFYSTYLFKFGYTGSRDLQGISVVAGCSIQLESLDSEGKVVKRGRCIIFAHQKAELQILQRPEVGLGYALPRGRNERIRIEKSSEPIVE